MHGDQGSRTNRNPSHGRTLARRPFPAIPSPFKGRTTDEDPSRCSPVPQRVLRHPTGPSGQFAVLWSGIRRGERQGQAVRSAGGADTLTGVKTWLGETVLKRFAH